MNIKEYLNKNTNVVFILSMFGALAVIIFISVTWLLPNDQTKPTDDTEPVETEWRCLGEDEVASYRKNKKKNEVSTATIFIKDKKSEKEKNSFEIELPLSGHYHPIEVHRCGVYADRSFGYDYIKREALGKYSHELWKYDYTGQGESLVLLSEKSDEFISYYGSDFRVSPSEQYVVLEHSYLGKDDYSLVIKDLNTKEDVFILKLSDITKKYPKVAGSFGMIDWKENDRYFWTDIFVGANTPGYVRIDTTEWSWEVFETPENAMGGFEPNYNTGWMPYAPKAVWTGVQQMDDQIREEAKARGQISTLFLYNLFTKKQIKIEETSLDPIWNFGPPTWVSDTELEYKTVAGETRVYEMVK